MRQAPALAFNVREVSAANLDELLRLEVASGQQQLVAPVARSLAQVAYEPAGRPLALYDGDTAAGLLLLYDARQDADRPVSQLIVWRLLVDARQQRRGIGRAAMSWVVEEARRLGVASVGLSHVERPGHAGPFYAGLGYVYTGEVDDGERVMRLDLAS
ncbi:GNAT family N-acetyltransferase [Rubrivivax sp. A210]|uniref:GNAT family N-acetyltransferase n=1 Tax=Rubrivivax sp. A210 TaxID=2772301 RepID=UPI001F3639BC|nr:GNAT family N-acetyltransferase [Rubrivivax sp. A210]